MLKTSASVLVLLCALSLGACDLAVSGDDSTSDAPASAPTSAASSGTPSGSEPSDDGSSAGTAAEQQGTARVDEVASTGSTWLANPHCTTSVTGWRASSNARLTDAGGTGDGCRLTRSLANGTSSVTATSALSQQRIDHAGSRVHVAGLVSASQSGRALSITLQEVDAQDRVLQSFTGHRTSGRGWGWVGAELRTKKADSRVRVVYRADGLDVGSSLGFKAGSVTVTAPVTPTPKPTPTKPTPTKPTPTPTKTSPTPTKPTPTKPTPTPTKPTPTKPSPTPTTPTPGQPERPSWVANTECLTSTSGWRATSNAILSDADGSTDGCRLTRRMTGGPSSVTAYSALSGRTVTTVGSRIHVASRVSASEAGRLLKITLQEVEPGGDVVQTFTGQRESGLSWVWVGAEMRSQVAGSHLRVVYSAEDLSGGSAFSFKDADVTVSAPSTASPTPAPEPTKPTEEPTAAPTTPVGSTTRTCDDLNSPSRRTLAFSDEFDGTSLDRSKWRTRDDDYLSFDAAYLRKENVVVDDGHLTIQGRRASSPYRVDSGIRDRWYTTGYIDTIGTFSQEYGRWEMRAKLPTHVDMTRGVWPAFWLRGDDTAGEIDIMEAYGGESTQQWNPARSYTSTLWENTNLGKDAGEWYTWAHDNWDTLALSQAVYQDFHTYGFNWTPDCMQFTYDDRVVETIPLSKLPWAEEAFSGPFNIRLNMQVGSPFWGMPDPKHTKDRFDYVVDSVKVYRTNR